MSRTARIAILSAGGLVLLLASVLATGIIVFRSDWFREKVRERVVAEAEKATNGRVEIGVFKLDWHTLTAEVENVVIHGTEPAGQAPLLAAKRVLIGLKIISLAERTFNVARIEVDSPRTHLIFQPGGNTNIPAPNRLTPQKLLDLRIGTFDVADGVILVEMPGRLPKTIPWSARGENFAGRANYNAMKARYDGNLSVAPVHIQWDDLGPVDAQITASLGMEKNRFTLSTATVKTAVSTIELHNAAVTDFVAPVATAEYSAKLALTEMDRIFKLVNFRHSGTVTVSGEARFASARDYLLSGAFQGAGLSYGKVRNLSANGQFAATPGKVLLSGIHAKALGGEVVASGEIRDLQRVHLTGNFEHFDASELTSLAEMPRLPYGGLLSGPFEVAGMLSERDFHDLAGHAKITVGPAPDKAAVRGELDVKYEGAGNTLDFGPSWLELAHSRVDFSGTLGRQLSVKLQSGNLNELRAALPIPDSLKTSPALFSASFEGNVAGPLADPRLAGHLTLRNAVYENQTIDSATADFTANRAGAAIDNAELASGGLRARVTGAFGFTKWKMTDASSLNATVQISKGQIASLLALLHVKDVPVTGTIDATAKIVGTVANPHATADLSLAKGQIYGEPYDALTGHAQYLNGGAQLFSGTITAGMKRVEVAGNLEARKLAFKIASNTIALDQLTLLRKTEPDIGGAARIKADGVVEISPDLKSVKIADLNADVAATALALGSRNFGDAHFTAATRNGIMTARLTSNAVRAAIQGEGTISLAGNYPVNAKLTFSNVKLNAVKAILSPSTSRTNGSTDNFDGVIAGQIMVSGPAFTPDMITASLDATQFELRPLSVTAPAQPIQNFVLRNAGPLRMTLAHSVIRIETAHFNGPDTNFELMGQIALNQAFPLDLRLQGTVGLPLAQTFNPDLTSAGQVVINSNIRGFWTNPLLDGRAELRKGEFHYAGFSNSLTGVDAVMLFSGSRVSIQSFTGESGGGKVDATGFATLTSGLLAFRMEAKARAVRVRYPEGVSSLSDADLTLAGTSERSEVSGTVTVRRMAINPKSDAATILASLTEPMRTPAAKSGLAANMNLDVQIETSPDVAFETSVAQSVQADASLRLRGTVTNPALLGRINITQGELVFFGNKYTVNQGTISFFNPAKIDPVINLSLETKARGVDVILTISGPVAKLNMSYRSDPPLQFGDIVALLATGRTPGNAALLAANNGTSAFQQLGASALIDQALANSGSNGRLQRFFGVSKIKIDPQLIGITGSPEARLTIEQQVTQQILFTYVSDVANTSTQLIRVEWDFNPRWAAILTREENGYVGLDFAWKKRFR